MEVDDIQTQACKFSRSNGNDKINSTKVGNRLTSNSHHHHLRPYPDDSDDGGEQQQLRHTFAATAAIGSTIGGGDDSTFPAAGEIGSGGPGSRLRSWQHSSRIIRVSRASGGKDRHSKVWTAKGPRDRRVRLSVATAIQFYDLQDRLGFDQPSKAVEWLIKAASDAISELPALNGSFPDTPRQLSDEKRGRAEQGLVGDSSIDVDLDAPNAGDPNFSQNQTQNQPGSNLSKSSACSSTSETSKGSGGLSLSRSEIRVKARERARERTAKEKDKETDSNAARVVHSQQNLNQQQQQHNHHHTLSHQTTSSFTQLLTAGIGLVSDENNPATGVGSSPSSQARQQWCNSSSPMDYFGSMGLMGPTSTTTSRANQNHINHPSGFIQLGNSIPQAMMVSPFMTIGGEPSHSSELHHQHFPYMPDHHLVVPAVPITTGSGSDHYLNFSISSSTNSPGLAGFSNSNNNRGTLQSNSSPSSLLPHLQRFSTTSSPLDGSAQLPFFLGAAVESHQHHHQFPAGLQLCYGDNSGSRHSEQKGKGKN